MTNDHFLIGYDFYHLWSAGRTVIAGGNPYDVSVIAPAMYAAGYPQSEGVYGFLQLPSTLWLYALFGLLPFTTAKIAWLMAMTSCSYLSALLLGRSSLGLFPRGAPSPVALLVGASIFPFLFSTTVWGQYNSLCLLGLIGGSLGRVGRSGFLAGLAASLLLFKPHLVLPFLGWRLAYDLRNRRGSWGAGFVVGALGQLVVSCAILPSALHVFVGALDVRGASALAGSAPAQLLSSFTGLSVLPRVAACLGLLVGVGAGLSGVDPTSRRLLILAVPLGLVCSPYSWAHTNLLLLPLFLLLFDGARQGWGFRGELLVLVSCLPFFPLALLPFWEQVMAIVPIVGLLGGVFVTSTWERWGATKNGTELLME
jgi:hypothetical protein